MKNQNGTKHSISENLAGFSRAEAYVHRQGG